MINEKVHRLERVEYGAAIRLSYTIPYKYLVSSETLSFFNSRHIDEEMVIPF